ncbi:MAG: hypothetical protein K2P19_06070 [Kineothrix sp.]|nr:hypothetical protein [Kineothrix sp.]
MLLCPVVAPLFFLFSYLIYRLPVWTELNLWDVIFSKERVRIQLKADEERERNVVPLEEAITVNEKTNLRMVMMNVLKGDIQSSLSTVSLALKINDTETSHYAASVLSDVLNEFRSNVQKMYVEMQKEPVCIEVAEAMIDYMNQILEQRVFTEIEQRHYIQMLDEAAELLYDYSEGSLTAKRCEGICMRFLEEREFEGAKKWCQRLSELHADELAAYTCKLKLYFTMKNRDAFFEALESLKESDVVIDYETLELIRLFS